MAPPHFVLGTAGHIDHGKTALVKALTGIDADRLKEEKERGITIELGFAHMDAAGMRVSIVDVPGHERFVRAMTAGATGMDAVMLVTAADEGVMPQTREHLAICNLLGIPAGFVALTKTDLVDEEWLELVKDDLKQFLAGSFLEDCPILPCSAATGAGIDAVKKEIEGLAAKLTGRPAKGLLRLPLDRVFTMHGFGTVVTGTLVSGRIRTGDDVVFLPSGVKSKVRGIQVHGGSVDSADAGQRVAVNLKGLEKAELSRGEVLVREDTVTPTHRFDARTTFLSWNRAPLKRRKPVLVLAGTTVREGVAVPLEAETLEPGQTGATQFHLKQPVVLLPGDRFILQGFDLNPQHGATVGGGIVVRTRGPKKRRPDPDYAAFLSELTKASPEHRVALELEARGFSGAEERHLAEALPYLPQETNRALEILLNKKEAVLFDKERRAVVHANALVRLQERIMAELKTLAEASPMAAGFPRQEIFSKLPSDVDPRLFRRGLDTLAAEKQLITDQENVALPGSQNKVQQKEVAEKALRLYERARLEPPKTAEAARKLDVDERDLKDVLATLVRDGRLTRARDNFMFHTDHIDALRAELVSYLEKHGEITPLQFKEMCGVTRKYLIPLAELFDDMRVTIRVGDVRKLRK